MYSSVAPVLHEITNHQQKIQADKPKILTQNSTMPQTIQNTTKVKRRQLIIS
jgi:hypothetical protein